MDRFEKEKVEKARMNMILNKHADWLDYNVSKVEGNRCRKQAVQYAKKDLRQKGVRKSER